MRHGGKVKGGSPHSERAGQGVLATGERAAVYRALLELSCSRCTGVIGEGALFTREVEPASGLPLVRLCGGCAPFTRVSGLMDELLAPGKNEKTPTAPEPGAAREKAMSRLRPALEAGRRRR